MNKHSVTINGQTITRNSKNRSYTHAVVCLPIRQAAEKSWFVAGWCSSERLALQSARTWENRGAKAFVVANGDQITLPEPTDEVRHEN